MRPLGGCGRVLGGGTPSKSNAAFWTGTIPWVTAKEMWTDEIRDSQLKISEAALKASPAKLIPANSVLFVVRGSILFKRVPVAVNRVVCTINQDMKAIVPDDDILPEYLALMMRATNGELKSRVGIAGNSAGKLETDEWSSVEIPVPPLAEQRRLVARIEAPTSRLEQARQARQAALAEAEVLSRSAAETDFQALRKKCGIKPIGDVCTTITDGDHNTPKFSESGVSFIFVGNVSSGRLHFENPRRVSTDYFKTLKSHRIPQRGDILYSAVGATLGIPVVVDTDEPFCFQRHVAILKPDRSKVDSQFAWHMLRSRTATNQAWASITGSAQPTIPLNAIRKLEIPVPPLAAQHRIGARLDALAAKQTELRRLQTETEAELAAFTPALLAKAFRGEL